VPVVNQGPSSNSAHRRQESASQQPLTAPVEQEKDYELEGTAPRAGGPGRKCDL